MAYSIRPPTRSTSDSTPQVDRATVGRGVTQVGKQVAGKLQQGDLNRVNKQVAGNQEDAVASVTFPLADRDVFVGHKLGYRVDNFEVILKSEKCDISRGSKAPTVYGMYVKSDTAGVTIRLRMFGQRTQRRG
jgi:hypothetical protein